MPNTISRAKALIYVLVISAFVLGGASKASAYYSPGQTLNPSCSPSDSTCDVMPSWGVESGGTGITSYNVGDFCSPTPPTLYLN